MVLLSRRGLVYSPRSRFRRVAFFTVSGSLFILPPIGRVTVFELEQIKRRVIADAMARKLHEEIAELRGLLLGFGKQIDGIDLAVRQSQGTVQGLNTTVKDMNGTVQRIDKNVLDLKNSVNMLRDNLKSVQPGH